MNTEELRAGGIKVLHETPEIGGFLIFGLESYTPGKEIGLTCCMGFIGEMDPIHIASVLERKAALIRQSVAEGAPKYQTLAEARANPLPGDVPR